MAKPFGPPDWKNVAPAPIGKPPYELAGPVLSCGSTFWSDDARDKLSPADKRAHKTAYNRFDKLVRERAALQLELVEQLMPSPEGRARLIDIAAGDHESGVRTKCALGLRKTAPTDAEWARLARELDVTAWVGKVTPETATNLAHVYALGAIALLRVEPASVVARYTPLLAPDVVAKSARGTYAAIAICYGIMHARRMGVDAAPAAGLAPHLAQHIVHNGKLHHQAMYALKELPHDEATAVAIARRMGPVDAVAYFNDDELKLLARSANPDYLPYFARALANSWTHWPPAFAYLDAIGTPLALAVLDRYCKDREGADDQQAAEKKVRASIGKRIGKVKLDADLQAQAAKLLA